MFSSLFSRFRRRHPADVKIGSMGGHGVLVTFSARDPKEYDLLFQGVHQLLASIYAGRLNVSRDPEGGR